ncbi:MAG TPA: hypothetical protein VMR76_00795 [Candidatus Saccharimonadia bacterium]|nr:hypothetical protein [Candidatus Saccharimonadia bacterium]
MNESLNKVFRKVPEITIIFWVAKLLTTAMGEATSDFFVFKINPYLAVTVGGIILVIALLMQFSVHRYIPWVYWFAVAMVAVFGTMAADALHIQIGIPYIVTTIFFALTLAIVFITWHRTEKTLSIHSINTHRREMFYWATVLATFALGTAAGDLTAITFHLGYFSSALLFSGLIVVPVIGYWLFNLNEVIAFWTAYVLTRPIGASFADWIGKSKRVGSLGFGDGRVSILLTIFIVILVGYMVFDRREVRRESKLT